MLVSLRSMLAVTALILQVTFLTITISSAAASQKATLSLGIDNDGVFFVDRDYSSGGFLTYSSKAISPYWWARPLSLSVWDIASLDKWEIQIGHDLWTPSDLELEKPQENERPYAGFLHSEVNYISLSPQLAQRFNLTVGVTGEDSLSEDMQKHVHSVTGSAHPNGWAYQVDEGVVGSAGYLVFFDLLRQPEFMDYELELSNISEINVGNFRSDIATGLMVRWGRDLSGSFGSAHISVENPFQPGMLGASANGWFVFLGVEGRYRFNDVTIEGDRDLDDLERSAEYYDVTLENWQASGVLGVAWYNENLGIALTFTGDSAEFEEETEKIHGTGALAFYVFF